MTIKYPKIQTVFSRDPETKYKTLLEGKFSKPEFMYLADCPWECTEKIDGTNIRVTWDGENVNFAGRTNEAQLYAPLVKRLIDVFRNQRLYKHFEINKVILFGEGYGAKIQKGGGNYIPDGVDFILFDVLFETAHNKNERKHGLFGMENDFLWLKHDSIVDIANNFGIKSVPSFGEYTIAEAVGMVRDGFQSEIGSQIAEGLVMRPKVELSNRLGERVITKIKHKDFR